MPVLLYLHDQQAKRLTLGDFHAVRVQYNSYLSGPSEVSHEVPVNALRRELALKHGEGAAGLTLKEE